MNAAKREKFTTQELKIRVLNRLLSVIPDSAIPNKKRAYWLLSAALQGARLNQDNALWLVEALGGIEIGCETPWLYNFLRESQRNRYKHWQNGIIG